MKYNPARQDHRDRLALMVLGKLTTCGFTPRPFDPTWGDRQEAVYQREIAGSGKSLFVRVYTSVVSENRKPTIRGCGADAIRIALVYQGEDFERGLKKATRVHRTGDFEAIVDRMHKRMQDMYRTGRNPERCSSCNKPKFLSKAGNMVCVETCWIKVHPNLPTPAPRP